MTPLRWLQVDVLDGTDGVATIEAFASTAAGDHALVLAEVDALLAWARAQFPHTAGAVEEGGDWDHDLQVTAEPGGWHAVTLTFGASPAFADAFAAAFVAE